MEMTAPQSPQPSAPSSAASDSYGPPGVHRGPYYSKAVDVPARAYEHGGRSWKLGTHTREEEEEPLLDVHGDQVGTFLGKMKEEVAAKRLKRKRRDGEEMNEARHWEFGFEAPTKGKALAWLKANGQEKEERESSCRLNRTDSKLNLIIACRTSSPAGVSGSCVIRCAQRL